MKACVEQNIKALMFKLQMFGVPINTSAKELCDNASVVKNSSILSSTLNKKYSSIAYHSVRWHLFAAGIIKVAWIDTNYNIADVFTKRLPGAEKREALFGKWTY